MKRALAFALITILIITVAGCAGDQKDNFDIASIKSYRDIPGVTEEEIEAIELLKETNSHFAYGCLETTFAFLMNDGAYHGFTPKICELLTSLFGIEFVPYIREWDDLIDGLNDKSIDFTGELTATPERMKHYFMSHSITEQTFSLYTLANSEPIMTESGLEGLRIGFLKGVITADLIREKYPVSFETVEVSTHRAAVEMLESGQIDAFVELSTSDIIFASDKNIRGKVFFSLAYGSVSLTTANPDLRAIISVLDKYLVAGGVDKLFELRQEGQDEYAKFEMDSSFTDQERAYLDDLAARNAKIPVAYESENYPVSFYNKREKEFQGFAIDILEELSGLTGLEFEAVNTKDTPWTEILDQLKTGEASMVTQLLYSDARKDDYLWSGVPYASSYYALLSKLEYPRIASYQIIRSTVGVIEQSGFKDMYEAWFPDSGNTISYSSTADALSALENGDIDLFMGSEYMLLAMTNYREKTGYKTNIRINVPMDSMFGFNKDQETLRSIIDKALPYVDTDSITQGWTDRVFDYSKKYAVQLSMFLFVFIAILIFVLAIVIYLFMKARRLDHELKREAATVQSIYESIPDMVYCKDISGNYISYNPSFEKLAGLKAKDILGKNDLQIFPEDREMALRFMETDKAVMSGQTPIVIEEFFTSSGKPQRLFESIKTPLMRDGALIGVLGISRDIQDHKNAVEAAQAASRAKSAFLAHMSHEIRTPMNAISGMTELVLREEISRPVYEYVSSIKHACANLLSIISDILDFSKIEAGGLEIMPSEYSLASLINDILIVMRMRVREKPVVFTVNIDSGIPNKLIGDEMRVRQILLNVLGNAAKYTNEGFIALNVTGAVEADTVVLTAEVSDSGVGVKKEDMDKLFVDFVRIDRNKNKKIQGTGLGLSIVKSLCLAMGGDISVRSEYEVGSVFTVTIPQKIAASDEKFAYVSEPETKRVLVYEASPLCAESIARSLDGLGVRGTVATDNRELYKHLKQTGYTHVFASSQFYETASGVLEELGLRTRLVLLMEFEEAPVFRGLRTMAKPVHSASIANTLNDMEAEVFSAESSREQVRFTAPNARVLIVDDLNTNLKVTEGLLQPYRMKVDVCGSGMEAVRLAQVNRYDMIFMDHMMPSMDGIETTDLIRSLQDDSGYYQRVPVIALTANAVSGVKEMFLQNGMNDYLAKPIDIVKLNGLLEKWIPEEKKERFRDSQIERQTADAGHALIQVDGLDTQCGIAMTGGDAQNYLKALAIFRVDGLEKIDKIRNSMENNELKSYTINMHALKSAAASLGSKEISGYAEMLETAGLKEDSRFIRENTERFLRELETLLQKIHTVLPEESDYEEPAGEQNTERLKNDLTALKKALYNADVNKIEEIMNAIQGVALNQEAKTAIDEISKCLLIYNYNEAFTLAGSFLDNLE